MVIGVEMDQFAVTPFTGVWIEIFGLSINPVFDHVTPFTGVWIEIRLGRLFHLYCTVTPFTGVWIEIGNPRQCSELDRWSHPSRVCGLKFLMRIHPRRQAEVTPFTGVWIEIGSTHPRSR